MLEPLRVSSTSSNLWAIDLNIDKNQRRTERGMYDVDGLWNICPSEFSILGGCRAALCSLGGLGSTSSSVSSNQCHRLQTRGGVCESSGRALGVLWHKTCAVRVRARTGRTSLYRLSFFISGYILLLCGNIHIYI